MKMKNENYLKQEDRIRLAEMWILYKEYFDAKESLIAPFNAALKDLDNKMKNLCVSVEVGLGLHHDFIPSEGSLNRLKSEFNELPEYYKEKLFELKVFLKENENDL